VIAGLAVIYVAVMVLTSWEVHLFRATTQDMDFTGRVCGTPFDHPGWARGDPCDGAVNRQLAGGLVLLGYGLVLVTASLVFGAWRSSRPSSMS